ncbi:MAG: PH domain-containing protein [Phycisphaerales bacterium JB039]
MDPAPPAAGTFDPHRFERPDERLLKYYLFVSLLTVVGFPFVFVPLVCKYITLRYRFDDEGVTMQWGVLMRREIVLTYRRIQDIHVTRNLLHRWLGLATLSIQTASGSAGAEMTIEGVTEPDALRDFLYHRMRGARGEAGPGAESSAHEDETISLLRDIRNAMATLAGGPAPAGHRMEPEP